MPIYNAQTKAKLYVGNVKVKKAYLGDTLVYSAGNIVTYKVDTNVTYMEEVEEGVSVLSPKSFTPAKSGWTFVGWRGDATANSSVYSSLVMGNNPITLHAVFRQNVTVTYYDTSTAAKSTSGNRYYNNGAVINPSFTLTQSTLSGYTARGWSTSSAANGAITYNNATAFTRDSNITLYGVYQQTITVNYYNYSTSVSTATGIRYYNPGSASALNPSFTLTQTAISGWTARGWSTGTAGNSGITYANGAAFTRDSNITLYGMYYQTITLSYDGNGATGGDTAAQSGYRYYNSNGAVVNPSFTLSGNGFSRSGASFVNWAAGSVGGTRYAAGASVALAANTIMYAVWTGIRQNLTLINNRVYVSDVDTFIDVSNPTLKQLSATPIDCSLYQGVVINLEQILAKTGHEGTGAYMVIYETGGNFLNLCEFHCDWASVGGKQESNRLVNYNTEYTLFFAQSSGSVNLYIGTQRSGYSFKDQVYGNLFFCFNYITLLPR